MKSWQEMADKLLAEQQADLRLPTAERVKKRLRWEDWQTLEAEAVRFATGELKRRRCRGRGCVLPGGFDAESIGSEAVADLLKGKGHLAPGWTRERLVKELERLIRRRVRLLASLKEGRVTQGGLGVEQSDPENELVRAVEQVPDGSSDGYEAAVTREEEEERGRLKWELESYLEGEPELVEVFRCLWAGVAKPAEIARRAGVEEKTVAVLRKRLERRIERFRGRMEQERRSGGRV